MRCGTPAGCAALLAARAKLGRRRFCGTVGAEESAGFTVDPAGYALACGGFNATLRDYGRFGLRDAKGKEVFGFGSKGLVATAEEIQAHLRGDSGSAWKRVS